MTTTIHKHLYKIPKDVKRRHTKTECSDYTIVHRLAKSYKLFIAKRSLSRTLSGPITFMI